MWPGGGEERMPPATGARWHKRHRWLCFIPIQAARLRRMRGEDMGSDSRKPKHLSADDLNDNFVLDKDDRRLLSYTVRGFSFTRWLAL